MSQLIQKRSPTENKLRLVRGDEALPDDAAQIAIDWTRYQSNEALPKDSRVVGVILGPATDPNELEKIPPSLKTIAIDFPAFTDGRGYSLARTLRKRLNYQGELRAIGDVLVDQLAYMERCGFDAFEVKDGIDLKRALRAFDEIDVKYQAAVDEALPLWKRRSS